MKDYMEYYEKNKQLDKIFEDKYGEIESKYYEKNCLELIVEICEFANESRCFKYWSIKKPSKDDLLEEYADCLSMLFYMFNYYNVLSVDVLDIELNDDIIVCFNEVIRMCTLLMKRENVDELLLKSIFTYLIHIARLLELGDSEILDSCYKKYEKNVERLNSNY